MTQRYRGHATRMALHEATGLGFAACVAGSRRGGFGASAMRRVAGCTCPLFYAYVVAASEHIHSNTKFRTESAARTMQPRTHAHVVLSFGHCSGGVCRGTSEHARQRARRTSLEHS